jgi:hypothetical protein
MWYLVSDESSKLLHTDTLEDKTYLVLFDEPFEHEEDVLAVKRVFIWMKGLLRCGNQESRVLFNSKLNKTIANFKQKRKSSSQFIGLEDSTFEKLEESFYVWMGLDH